MRHLFVGLFDLFLFLCCAVVDVDGVVWRVDCWRWRSALSTTNASMNAPLPPKCKNQKYSNKTLSFSLSCNLRKVECFPPLFNSVSSMTPPRCSSTFNSSPTSPTPSRTHRRLSRRHRRSSRRRRRHCPRRPHAAPSRAPSTMRLQPTRAMRSNTLLDCCCHEQLPILDRQRRVEQSE
jgi:hypothetical protein